MEKGDVEGALQAYRTAEEMYPGNLEIRYWCAVSLVNVGRVDKALPIFRGIFGRDPNWLTLTRRLPGVDLLKASNEDLQRILAQGAQQ
jgi:NRPS condensation-like uncharacterized protein